MHGFELWVQGQLKPPKPPKLPLPELEPPVRKAHQARLADGRRQVEGYLEEVPEVSESPQSLRSRQPEQEPEARHGGRVEAWQVQTSVQSVHEPLQCHRRVNFECRPSYGRHLHSLMPQAVPLQHQRMCSPPRIPVYKSQVQPQLLGWHRPAQETVRHVSPSRISPRRMVMPPPPQLLRPASVRVPSPAGTSLRVPSPVPEMRIRRASSPEHFTPRYRTTLPAPRGRATVPAYRTSPCFAPYVARSPSPTPLVRMPVSYQVTGVSAPIMRDIRARTPSPPAPVSGQPLCVVPAPALAPEPRSFALRPNFTGPDCADMAVPSGVHDRMLQREGGQGGQVLAGVGCLPRPPRGFGRSTQAPGAAPRLCCGLRL